MIEKQYPNKSQYSAEELEKRKRQLSSKKGIVTKAKNQIEKIEEEAATIENERRQIKSGIDKTKKAYQDTEKYKEYLLTQSRATEEYAAYVKYVNRSDELDNQVDTIYSRLDDAETSYENAQKEFDHSI